MLIFILTQDPKESQDLSGSEVNIMKDLLASLKGLDVLTVPPSLILIYNKQPDAMFSKRREPELSQMKKVRQQIYSSVSPF